MGARSGRLFYGDNLDILRGTYLDGAVRRPYIPAASVDLIYLDPPFQSGRNYNMLFHEHDGAKSQAQDAAFQDTWRWHDETPREYNRLVTHGGAVGEILLALHGLLGGCEMMAYLTMMAPRLAELWRVLKPTGSLYLHCDPAASHYLKVMMDTLFGSACFRNEITWCYRKFGRAGSYFPRSHDTLLFYAKGDNVFNPLYVAPSPSTLKRWGTKKRGGKTPADRHATDEESPGAVMPDHWDINLIIGANPERLGYPTQKPEALLERVIRASSNEGDVVLDPFCGCGTSVVVAHKLRRRWIGIDVTHLAVGLIKSRMRDTFGDAVRETFDIVGEPVDLSGARDLAARDRHQFEHWALGLVGARRAAKRKGADRGIDGQLPFFAGKAVGHDRVLISVKSGKAGVRDVRDLRGTVAREKAAIGLLITLRPPTRPMLTEAAEAGEYVIHAPGRAAFPRIQVLTVEALLGAQVRGTPLLRSPAWAPSLAHKQAPPSPGGADQADLFT